MLQAIVNLGMSLGLASTAEGVETDGMRQLLNRLGCNEAQGYFYTKPLPADQAKAWIKDFTKV
jgi:EAL domain-containing protein (putative c-di-GMP-specific phosphodiesterase class I)